MPLRCFIFKTCFALMLTAAITPSFVLHSQAADEWRHATSLNGEPKYAAGFPHFDYVNPDAPKGGTARTAVVGTFDSLNAHTDKGSPASGLTLLNETLMEPSLDEINISAMYGLIASEMRYPADYSSVSFKLDPDAKWHDGTPITVDDVIWSFEALTAIDAQVKFYYKNVTSYEQTADNEVTFRFDVTGNRELPHIIGQLTILPKHWWTSTNDKGEPRDISRGTLEPPLGSGPYRIGAFDVGRSITFERVEDYWAAQKPLNVGKHNFDELTFEYFRDTSVLLEAFKADAYDYRAENSAKNWSTGYENFAARDRGDVILETIPDESSGVMQAYVVNMRRDKFKDQRVRRALALAYDFQSANRTVYYDLYFQPDSYFSGSELASKGLPEGDELAILKQVAAEFPDTFPQNVFTETFKNPVYPDRDNAARQANLREASSLLREAGYTVRDGKMVNAETGEQLTIEFLYHSPDADRQVQFWRTQLELLGIGFSIRVVDTSTYIERLRTFDYDAIIMGWGQSLSPGNEQRNYWGSDSVSLEGSRNYAGIADPAIDALIDRVIFAPDRQALVDSVRALDRVLLANEFVIPQLFYPFDRIAYWNRFGHPDPFPRYSVGFPTVWWFDEEKAAKITK